jgi:hypothetical protein
MHNQTIKSLMNRIETIARQEYRDIVGQLTCMLDMYEKQTGVKSKRTYTKRKAKSVVTSDVPAVARKKRKPLTAKQKKNISMGRRLANARKKLSLVSAN